MQLENSFVVPVPLDQAWQVLLDVERIAPCMPGATLDSVDGDDIAGRVKVKVGPITITYRGTARFASRDEGSHTAVIEASGKETRGAGTARATVRTALVERGDETEVRVETDLAVTGRPAQFGRGVLAEVSGKLIDQFAACLAEEVRGGTAAAAAPAAQAAASSEPGGEQAEPAAAPAVPAAAAGPATPVAPAPAAAPLPPAGAPQQPAPAPAPAPAAAAAPAAHHHRVEAIDLLEAAGLPVAKRLLPVAAAVLVAWLLVRVLRRR